MRIDVALEVEAGDPQIVIDFLVSNVNLSKTKLKDCMAKGAVWVKKEQSARFRVRRAMTDLFVGDVVEIFYDEELLSLSPPNAVCLKDNEKYSVWYKPAGMITQGNQWGDHCALGRQIELFFKNQREVQLINHLDREASGLVIVSHTRRAASLLTEQFEQNQVARKYTADVKGELKEGGQFDLGYKLSATYEVKKYISHTDFTQLIVKVSSERKHELRQAFDELGHGIIGDPLYGKGNKNTEGMKLALVALTFECPLKREQTTFDLYELRKNA